MNVYSFDDDNIFATIDSEIDMMARSKVVKHLKTLNTYYLDLDPSDKMYQRILDSNKIVMRKIRWYGITSITIYSDTFDITDLKPIDAEQAEKDEEIQKQNEQELQEIRDSMNI